VVQLVINFLSNVEESGPGGTLIGMITETESGQGVISDTVGAIGEIART